MLGLALLEGLFFLHLILSWHLALTGGQSSDLVVCCSKDCEEGKKSQVAMTVLVSNKRFTVEVTVRPFKLTCHHIFHTKPDSQTAILTARALHMSIIIYSMNIYNYAHAQCMNSWC